MNKAGQIIVPEIQKVTPVIDAKKYLVPPVLEPVKDGYGYMAILMETEDGEKLQCHECGKLFARLEAHVRQAHKISCKDYRIKYQLSPSTRLVSKNNLKKQGAASRENWKKLTPEQQETHRKKMRRQLSKWKKKVAAQKKFQPKLALEERYKRGTALEQLLQYIRDLAKRIGHTPSIRDLLVSENGRQRYKYLIFREFGTWKNAIKAAGLPPLTVTIPPPKKRSTKELLDILKLFYQVHKRIPVETDMKMGLIPSADTYKRRFGSLKKARELAGLEQPKGRWGK